MVSTRWYFGQRLCQAGGGILAAGEEDEGGGVHPPMVIKKMEGPERRCGKPASPVRQHAHIAVDGGPLPRGFALVRGAYVDEAQGIFARGEIKQRSQGL
jgi:hypothetical protein